MKLEIPCRQCLFTDGGPVANNSVTPIGDTSIYEVTCSNGHFGKTILLNHKFELLFESGILALRDGYYREAVTSFAVALERFHEFSIALLFQDKFTEVKGNYMVKLRKFAVLWTTGLKLSERQHGAFQAMYFNEFNEAPVQFNQSFAKGRGLDEKVSDPVNFRNLVTHEGYIPSREQTVQYAALVHDYIDKLLRKYIEKDSHREQSRLSLMSALYLGLAVIKRKYEYMISGPTTRISTFIRSDDPTYFESRQAFTDYLENGQQCE